MNKPAGSDEDAPPALLPPGNTAKEDHPTVEQLQKRIEELERRVEALEKAMKETKQENDEWRMMHISSVIFRDLDRQQV